MLVAMLRIGRRASLALLVCSVACAGPELPRRAAAARPAPLHDAVTITAHVEAYEELPAELSLALTAADGPAYFRCAPSPSCSATLERPRGESPILSLTYRPAAGAELRTLRAPIELPSDVRAVEVQLRFAELLPQHWIWLTRAAVLRARAIAPSARLVREREDPAGRPSYLIRNEGSTRTYWPVDGAHIEGVWQRWEGDRWSQLERQSGGWYCGNVGGVAPLTPGDEVVTREQMGRVGRENALPAGRVRYLVRVGEVLDEGVIVMSAHARDAIAVPMLVDVYELSDEVSVAPLAISSSELDPTTAVDDD